MLWWGYQKNQGYFLHWRAIIPKRWIHFSECYYFFFLQIFNYPQTNNKKNKWSFVTKGMNLNYLALPTAKFCLLFLIIFTLDCFLIVRSYPWSSSLHEREKCFPMPLVMDASLEKQSTFFRKKVPDNYLRVIVWFCGILLFLISTQSALLASLSSVELFWMHFIAKSLLQKLQHKWNLCFCFKVGQRLFPSNVLAPAYLKLIITQGHRGNRLCPSSGIF